MFPEAKNLVILGIGNSIRMDDGAGIRVVEQLEQDISLRSLKIAFKYLNTGGFDVLDEIDGYKQAIIVDAADMPDQGLKPGNIFYCPNLHELVIEEVGGISSHGIGVFNVLKYAKMGNYQAPPIIEVYGIQVKETKYFSEELTPEVAGGVEKLVTHLKNHIFSLMKDQC
jgi:hydrogenase maturation protease